MAASLFLKKRYKSGSPKKSNVETKKLIGASQDIVAASKGKQIRTIKSIELGLDFLVILFFISNKEYHKRFEKKLVSTDNGSINGISQNTNI
jgi:hypothetical protein